MLYRIERDSSWFGVLDERGGFSLKEIFFEIMDILTLAYEGRNAFAKAL